MNDSAYFSLGMVAGSIFTLAVLFVIGMQRPPTRP